MVAQPGFVCVCVCVATRTFGELSRPEELYSKCLELCQSLAEDLAKKQLVVRTSVVFYMNCTVASLMKRFVSVPH